MKDFLYPLAPWTFFVAIAADLTVRYKNGDTVQYSKVKTEICCLYVGTMSLR